MFQFRGTRSDAFGRAKHYEHLGATSNFRCHKEISRTERVSSLQSGGPMETVTIPQAGGVQENNHRRTGWFYVPVKWITGSPEASGYLAKSILILAPLQYYVLTFYPGGFQSDDFIAAMIVQLILIIILFVVSSVFGLIGSILERFASGKRASPHEKIRAWSIALFSCWGFTILLLAISHSVSGIVTGKKYDLVGFAMCSTIGCPSGYPNWDLRTLFVFLSYSVLAVALVRITPGTLRTLAVWWSRSPQFGLQRRATAGDPNVIAVVLANAAVVTAVFSLTNN
jgi:hypothetical protein